MKVLLLIALLSTHAMADCHKDSKGARALHEEIWDTTNVTSLEIEKIKIGAVDGYKVINNDSCGVQGCETTLIVNDTKGCLKTVLDYDGKAVLKKDWKSITVLQKTLAVDGEVKNKSKEYNFDSETMTYKK